MSNRIVAVIGLFSLLLLCVVPAHAGPPDLKGTWKGTSRGYLKGKGFVASKEGARTLVIAEQNSDVFFGKKEYEANGKVVSEGFAGTISEDGDVYLAEENQGVIIGKYKDGVLKLYYLEGGDGNAVVMVHEFKR